MAPSLLALWTRDGVKRVFFSLAVLVSVLSLSVSVYSMLVPTLRAATLTDYGIDPVGPLMCIGLSGMLWCMFTRVRHAAMAWFGVLVITLSVVGVWVNPVMNPVRSSAAFVQNVERLAGSVTELGLVGYSEEYLLEFKRPTVNFGHARWREWEQEADDAAAWLSAATNRTLLINDQVRQRCFSAARLQTIRDGNGENWYLVSQGADSACVQRGKMAVALKYQP
jgi:hypothetical protein